MKTFCIILFVALSCVQARAQQHTPEEYKEMKAKKLAEKSPFEKIVDRELPATIVYENDYVIAIVPLRSQAPVHYLIIPKKRLPTVNDITEADVPALGQMFLAAKEIARKFGVADTGYRLVINTNRDASQSEFHLHMHLLGGEYLGPMREVKK